MRVLDASVVTNALTSTGTAGATARQLMARETTLYAPALLAVEIASALRSLLRRGLLDIVAADVAVREVAALRTRQFPVEPFLDRIWQLRDNVSAYDAWYVALAEAVGAELVTGDVRLRSATGPRCPVLSPAEALQRA